MPTEYQAAAAAMLPHLMAAESYLRSLAAPQASKLSERIGALLAETAELGEDVAMYYRKWPGHGPVTGMAELDALAETTGRYR